MHRSIDTKIFSISLITVLCVNFFAGPEITRNFKNQILFFIIPLIWPGVAHGSLDLEIAKKKGLIKNNFHIFCFLFLYILIPVVFFYLWIIFPNTFFILFLLLSYLHFGISDNLSQKSVNKYFEIIIRGAVIIFVPILSHNETTIQIFTILLANETILIHLEKYYPLLGFFLIAFLVSWISMNIYKEGLRFFEEIVFWEIVLLITCFVIFDPLVAFFTYFCFLHSVRHMLDEKVSLNLKLDQLIIMSLPFTIATILFFSSIFYYYTFFDHNEKILSYIFVGLASLTTSHILLVNFSKK